MNKSFEKIRAVAKRSLKILDLIEQGYKVQQIVEKLGVNRQLVDYYIKVYNNDKLNAKGRIERKELYGKRKV